MEDDFGVVPVPKFNTSQNSYHSYVIPCDVYVISVPITCPKADEIGTAMQSLAILSANYMTPAYYDITLTGKGMRDEESSEMPDIILSTTVYDIARMYDFGGFPAGIVLMLENQTELVLNYEKRAKAMTKAIEKVILDIGENTYS